MQQLSQSNSANLKWANLKKGSHIHLMGICGTAMGSLAGLLVDRGFKVTGSDQNVYPPMSTQLQKLGIKIMEGYKAENLTIKPDLVVVGNVISKNFPEAQALLQSEIPYTSLPQAMGEFVIENRHSVVVAGTHGKTTTSSLVAWILEIAGLQPGFLIGGIPQNFSQSYRLPKKDFFVIEGDEYDTAFFDKVPKFIHYKPTSAILGNIEFDHADIYRDLDHVKSAFGMLTTLIPNHGRLIYWAEDQNIADVLKQFPCKGQLIGFGFTQGIYRAQKDGSDFILTKNGVNLGKIKSALIGDYNRKNIMAAAALSLELGIPFSAVQKAVESFSGVKRRAEIIGEPGDVLLIEDFAHHPTAVAGTIEAVQSRYPSSKVYSIFEPRSATSRRKVFQKDYVKAFAKAQAVLFPPVFDQSKIAEDDRFSIDDLVFDLQKQNVDAKVMASVDAIVEDIGKRAKPKDVVLIMSNGGFGGIYEKLKTTLSVRDRSKA